MAYCEGAEKAEVRYSFGSKSGSMKFSNPPIEVNIYSPGPWIFKFYYDDLMSSRWDRYIEREIFAETLDVSILRVEYENNNKRSILYYSDGPVTRSIILIDNRNNSHTVTQGELLGGGSWRIKASEGQSSLSLEDKGDVKPTYTVICNSECPEGTVKCNCRGGFCCLQCQEISAEIKNIRRLLLHT